MTPHAWLALVGLLVQSGDVERQRNLGKAYYEQGEYALATDAFGSIVDSGDAQARDYFNAAMAYLQNAEQDRALAAFATAQQMDPELAEVDFGLGVLYKRQLRYPLAHEAFSRVAEHDPDDPSTWFNIGAVSSSMRRTDEAEQAFQKVMAMGHARARNFYVSALFRQATILAQRGEQTQAQALFEEFQTLRDEIPNVSLTPTALENGKYGRVEIPIARKTAIEAAPSSLELTQVGELRFAESPCEREPSLALGDYDADGDVDIFVTSPCEGGALFRNDGGGELTDVTDDVGLAPGHASAGAVFVDFDNSGFPSLFVWGDSESHLVRNRSGRFEDVTPDGGLSSGATTALFVDADNDGRVDLFASQADAGLVLYRNLDEGRFASVWRDATTHARGAAAADFDDNGFMDIIVAPVSGEGFVLSNEGGVFQPSAVSLRLPGTSATRVHVIDLDHDGWLDIVASDEKAATTLVNRRGRLELFPALQGWASLVPLELDGDGYASFLARDARGRQSLVSYQGGQRFEARPNVLADVASGLIATLDENVLTASRDGFVRVYERAKPAAGSWLRIALEGTKTNRQALGAVVELKAGSFYQKHLYPGHPITLFVGERDHLDVVRITWANGVIQNEVDVTTRQALDIEEAEQQTSSCPFIYLWDGEGFRFLTDVVGRAPLGEILPDGGVVVPNPEDYVRIPPGAMVPRDGRFVFQLTEELRELAAIDAVELLAIDHPRDVEVYANERFSAPPFPPFQLYAVNETWSPSSAADLRGHDVLDQLSRADGVYVTSFSRHRISGFAEEHAVVLTVPENVHDESLWLFLTGWVYWPSSSSMQALDSHGSMTVRAPALQVKDGRGEWVTVIEDLGLPSGMGRTLTADLTGKFLSDDRQVRIVSNFAVYWDRALLGRPATSAATTRTRVLEPSTAELHYRGFSVVSLESREKPERYDYARLETEPPWNAVAGRYTRFGDVTPLLDDADGAMVVMAPGDEMSLAFDAGNLPPLPKGWSRTFFLHVTGWAKDQDPNTLSSRTVSPLPGREAQTMMPYQTREVPTLVTPLMPSNSLPDRSK